MKRIAYIDAMYCKFDPRCDGLVRADGYCDKHAEQQFNWDMQDMDAEDAYWDSMNEDYCKYCDGPCCAE